jgi:hypothetical protein
MLDQCEANGGSDETEDLESKPVGQEADTGEKLKYRKQTAKDAFGEQLLKRKGSIDPDVDLEF